MKTKQIAYSIVRKNTRNKYHPNAFCPVLFDERVPVYWIKSVAKRKALEIDAEVVQVEIIPINSNAK